MINPNELNEYELKNKKSHFKDAPITSTRLYIKRLSNLQIFSICIIFLAGLLQAIAIGTNDWFVLNVNEYIPTSKGGLWNYCYIATNGYMGQFTCLKYEELPNYAIFINSRLYDSRVLLICSCGFCFLLMFIEIFGLMCLCLAETKGDYIDSFVARRSSRFRIEKARPTELMYPSSPQTKSKSQNSSKIVGYNDETTNSARFTTSIIVNANPEQSEYYQTIKPTGYFAFLAIALITLVGSVMDFVLKVAGFALFDAYITRLLQFNTVFIAFRSYSYWMMVVSIALIFFFWLFKIFSARYVINLTKNLLRERVPINDIVLPSISNNPQSASQYEPFKTNYTTITRIQDDNSDSFDKYNMNMQTYPIKSTFIYDMDSNEDDLSSSPYSTRQHSTSSNYYHEYLQQPDSVKNLSFTETHSIENKSFSSVIRF